MYSSRLIKFLQKRLISSYDEISHNLNQRKQGFQLRSDSSIFRCISTSRFHKFCLSVCVSVCPRFVQSIQKTIQSSMLLLQSCIVLYSPTLSCIVLYSPLQSHIYSPILFCIVLYSTGYYCVVLYSPVLSCIVLYSPVQSCIVLHSSIK